MRLDQLENIPTNKLHEVAYIELPGIYTPSDWGKEFHRCTADEMLGAGSAGPGKSLVGLNDAAAQIVVAKELCRRKERPLGSVNGTALHLRRELKGLEVSKRRARILMPALDPSASWRDKDNKWVFASGYEYQFGHCKDPNDWENYYGLEYSHLFFDELSAFTEEQYQQIASRVRSDDPVLSLMLKIRAASNPHPGWVRKYFVDPYPKGRGVIRSKVVRQDGSEETVTKVYIPATLYDNPNKAFVKAYEKKLLTRPKRIREALLYGNWWYVEGAFFSDAWRAELHVVKPFKIPGDWPIFRTCDWGYKSKGVILWFATDPDGNLYVIREWAFREMSGKQVAENIKEIEMAMGLRTTSKRSYITGPADTNLWSNHNNNDSHAMQMAKEGVYWVQADKKSRRMNAERLLVRLSDHANGLKRPGIMFFDTCQDCIRTIPAIPTDPANTDEPLKCDIDHHKDATEFGCAYAAQSQESYAKRIAAGDPHNDEEERFYAKHDKQKPENRGKFGYG